MILIEYTQILFGIKDNIDNYNKNNVESYPLNSKSNQDIDTKNSIINSINNGVIKTMYSIIKATNKRHEYRKYSDLKLVCHKLQDRHKYIDVMDILFV